MSESEAPPTPVVEEETFISLCKPASAEFMGSIFFLFMAVGLATSTVDYINTTAVPQVAIALAFGFCIFVLAFTIGHISGGHLNCAVTLGFVVCRKISWKRGIMYFGGQLFGGLIGVALLKWWHPQRFQLHCYGANDLGANIGIGMAFGFEFVLTMFLLFVVCAASDSQKSNTTLVPLAIGTAVAVAHMAALPITGCSINPTRSFASAFVSLGSDGCAQIWDAHWVFWFAPCFGAVAGCLLYELLFGPGKGFRNTLRAMYVVDKD